MKTNPCRPLGLAGALVLGLCLAAPGAHAQTVQNGSFENPAFGYVTYGDGAGDDWDYTGNSYVITNDYGYGNTPYGSQWEFLQDSSASVTQTIASGFEINRTYTLSVQASDCLGSNLDQLTMTISGAATASATYTLPARDGVDYASDFSFAAYTVDFTPTTDGPVAINLSSSNDNGSAFALDDVKLAVQAVPEPSTWSCVAGLLGVMGLTLRRRVRAALVQGFRHPTCGR